MARRARQRGSGPLTGVVSLVASALTSGPPSANAGELPPEHAALAKPRSRHANESFEVVARCMPDGARSGRPVADRANPARTKYAAAAMTTEIFGAYDGREAKERRLRAVAQAEERFPEVERIFREVYGMPFPRHVTYAAAFFLGLSREERELCSVRASGMMQWFGWLAEGERRVAHLDARLESRYRLDPPEFVTLATGDSDGSHWGLFYDEPHALPTLIAHGWARDDGVVRPAGRTLLASIRAELRESGHLDEEDQLRVRAMVAWLSALVDHEQRVRAEQRIPPPPTERIDLAHEGVGAYLPNFTLPADIPVAYARWDVWRKDEATALEWVARADDALARGEPGLALVFGLELHHLDRDDRRAECTRLLVGAYEALDRKPLAEIVRVHHAHRDLRSVGVYGYPREGAEPSAPETPWAPPPVLLAVKALDEDALEEALEAAPSINDLSLAASDLADTWGRGNANPRVKARALAMLDRLLDHGGAALAASCFGYHLIAIRRSVDPEELVRVSSRRDPQQTRDTIEHLLRPRDRSMVDRIIAYGAPLTSDVDLHMAVATGQTDLVAFALKSANDPVGYRGIYTDVAGLVEGATLLHLAVCAANADALALLVERGLDPEIRDGAGRTARELAKMLWFVRPNEANRMVELLDARKPKEAPAPATPSFAVGAAVTHKKFRDASG
jgi:hypothetical protein